MPASKQMVLAMIVKQYECQQDFVHVPDALQSKARALVRSGMLIEGAEFGHFRPSQLGIMSAGEME